jgi:hypothetical protein
MLAIEMKNDVKQVRGALSWLDASLHFGWRTQVTHEVRRLAVNSRSPIPQRVAFGWGGTERDSNLPSHYLVSTYEFEKREYGDEEGSFRGEGLFPEPGLPNTSTFSRRSRKEPSRRLSSCRVTCRGSRFQSKLAQVFAVGRRDCCRRRAVSLSRRGLRLSLNNENPGILIAARRLPTGTRIREF